MHKKANTHDNIYFFALDSKNKDLVKIKSSFGAKWIYRDDNNIYRITSNPVRGYISSLSEIAYPKIKYYFGDDPVKDRIIFRLYENNLFMDLCNIEPHEILTPPHTKLKDFTTIHLDNNNDNNYNHNNQKNINILIYDTETTGLYDTDRITQIAVYNPLDDTYFLETINPQMRINAEASALTGLTDRILRTKPTFSQIVESFEEFIFKDTCSNTIILMIAHNNTFDENKLRKEYELLNEPLPSMFQNVIFCDSLDMCKCWIHGDSYERNPTTGKPVAGVFKLSTTPDSGDKYGKDLYYRFMGRHLDGAHNALADVKGLWEILNEMFLQIWECNNYNFICIMILHFTLISEITDQNYMNEIRSRI
jgi:DNA polymerase III epsilon subunit-like protein